MPSHKILKGNVLPLGDFLAYLLTLEPNFWIMVVMDDFHTNYSSILSLRDLGEWKGKEKGKGKKRRNRINCSGDQITSG